MDLPIYHELSKEIMKAIVTAQYGNKEQLKGKKA